MVARKTGISRDLLIHPGETVRDILEERNISQTELASSLGVTPAYISKVISGQKDISNQLAMSLEYALDVPKSFWINLQKNYDTELLELEESESITEEEKQLAKELDDVVKHLRAISDLPPKLKASDKVIALRRYLRTSNLSNLLKLAPQGNFRKSTGDKMRPVVVGAWLRLAQLATEGIVGNHRFKAPDAKEIVMRIKEIMLESSAANYIEDMQTLMAEYGIAFAIVQHFTGAPIHGYVTRGANGTLRMAVTIRGAYEDIFWFSILHELGHIVNGDLDKRRGEFLDDDADFQKETLANDFARDSLINPEDYEEFLRNNGSNPTLSSIKSFANSQRVTPGIVIGRLMKEEVIPWTKFTSQRRKLVWA